MKTFAKEKEAVATSAVLPQHSQFKMPNTLLGGHTASRRLCRRRPRAPLCNKCPVYVTILDIPASLVARTRRSRRTNPFTFTVTLLPSGEPNGYKPTGLYHDDDLVPMCATSDLGATTHICLTGFQVSNKNGIVATGRADQNGRIGFG